MARLALLTAIAAVALVAAAAASGRTPKDPVARHNAADMAKARAIVVKRRDLGAGWTGHTPDTSDETCGARPDDSDLVETGHGYSPDFTYKDRVTSVSSEARLFRSNAHAATDWRRSANLSRLRRCALQDMRQESTRRTTFKLVALRRLRFPQLAPRVFALRAIIRVSGTSGSGNFVTDVIAVGRGRAVATVSFITLERPFDSTRELAVARALAGRLPAA